MRSWLLIPADKGTALADAVRAGADAVVIDLARPLPSGRRAAARLRATDWLLTQREHLDRRPRFQRWARISGMGSAGWADDLDAAMDGLPHGIVLSHCRGAEDVRQLASRLDEIEDRLGLAAGITQIVPQLGATPTCALALPRFADEVHPRVCALTWDAVALASAMGARRLRGPAGRWSDPLAQVRGQMLLIAHARGLGAIDFAFRDAKDLEAGKRIAATARADGCTGMFAIHPRQVAGINAAFAPLESEIEEARRIVNAFESDGQADALNVAERWVARPEVLRAKRLLGED